MVDVKDLQGGIGILPLLAVDKAADAQPGRVVGKGICRDDAGPDGGKAVQTLAKVPLLVRRLHIPGRDIVQDGIAEDVVPGLTGGHIPGIPAQHHSQLTLVIQLFHQIGVGLDGAAVRHGAGHALGKVDGILVLGGKGSGRIFLRLIGVGHIIDAQADDILCRGRDGAFQRDGLHRQSGNARNGQRQPIPHLRGQKRDGLAQGLIAQAQPAQRPDLPPILR